MQNEPGHSLWTWLQYVGTAWEVPGLVFAAFWIGRMYTKLEARVAKAESQVDSLVTRHMPSIHKALAEIRSVLVVMKGKQ